MVDVTETIDDTAERVYRRFFNPEIEPSVKEWAAGELEKIQRELDYVCNGDMGYENYLLMAVQQAVDRYDVDGEELPDGVEPREAPLCTCADVGCHLKRGQLPGRIRNADSIERGVQLFKQEHTGEPRVLEDALDEWAAMRGEVFATLRYVSAHMTQEAEEPPTADETDEEAAAD